MKALYLTLRAPALACCAFAGAPALSCFAFVRAAALACCTIAFAAVLASDPAEAQTIIPAALTRLRPIQCVAYDPKPSDFPQPAYYDSDFFNADFKGIWGDDGQSGARTDIANLVQDHVNLLHLYNWNPQRSSHGAFLDEAAKEGARVMVPISNFTAQTITGTTGCPTCPNGYQAAFNLIEGIFNQVYTAGKPHAAVAMWGIYNEYDLGKINPVDVAFVVQAILTLEDRAGIAAANRLPITVPVSDATFARDQRSALSRELSQAFERATRQWLQTNPGKNVDKSPSDLPGAVLAILAVANALSDSVARTSYQSKFDASAVTVSPVPSDFWKTRFIASSNPFRDGTALTNFLTSTAQFQSAFPGTTAWNTLPPLFFAEMGYSQKDAGFDLNRQAEFVAGQIAATHSLAVSGATTQGYFLGSCFFQHTLVNPNRFEGFDFVAGQYSTHTGSGGAYRVDRLTPLPVWEKVRQGYAPSTTGTESKPITVVFNNYCAGQPIKVYVTPSDGSQCQEVKTQPAVLVAGTNAFSAVFSSPDECATATRPEFTPGANGDTSYDLSTNGSWPQQPVPYFNVPARILAIQATTSPPCALPEWNGQFDAQSLRGVSTQICADAKCKTAYQDPTSGPQFIVNDRGVRQFIVEWCPAQNPSPMPTCVVPQFVTSKPCPSLCRDDAVTSAWPCVDQTADNLPKAMCNIAPFGGAPPAAYCLSQSDCGKYAGQSCGCCASNSDCAAGQSCVGFVCQ